MSRPPERPSGRQAGLRERERIRALYNFPPDPGPRRVPAISFIVQLEDKPNGADVDRPASSRQDR